MILRLLLAAAVGAIMGYQRERAGKPAGLRTHTFICIGATLFSVFSVYGFSTVADANLLVAKWRHGA